MTNLPPWILCCAMLLAPGLSHANEDIPLLQPDEQRAVEQQTSDFSNAWQSTLTEAAKSTVRVWSGKKRLAYGTVVSDGTRILTKWSELEASGNEFIIEGNGGQTRSAKIVGVYPDEDLVVLEFAGTSLPAARWSEKPIPLGSFVATPQPDGRPAAYGVVSVESRNLRETDQAFLGIRADPKHTDQGVRIAGVEEGSGAEAAGLRKGDVIRKIGDREISGLLELRNALTGVQPGDEVRIEYARGNQQETIDVELGNRRSGFAQFEGARLEGMKRMGGPISRVSTNFSSAIQTDMRPRPNQIGGPVVNLDGEVVGITLARADRTRSFFMPATAVQELLATPATDPSVARTQAREQLAKAERPNRPRRILPRDSDLPQVRPERLRQHLEEMQQLMEFMQREMEMLEEGR